MRGVGALRRTALVLAAVVTVLLLPAVSAAVVAPRAFTDPYTPGPPRVVPAPAPPPHDPGRPTAVVVVSDRGGLVSDVLAPYQVLAETGRFNLYTVAPQRRPLPLTGGLDLVPDLTFDELAGRTARADLVVVPAPPDDEPATTAPVAGWLRGQADRGAMVLSVCNGAGTVAAAGLLDGRPATSHWNRLGRYAARHPAVDWVRGQRVVDDGDVVSTAGILAGIDGTLHVVERLAGPAVADRAAAAVGWRYFRADPPAQDRLAVPDPPAILNAGYRWDPTTVGVLLDDGVAEIELASVFDAYGGQSLATRTLALGVDGAPVRSRHGLVFLPRDNLAGGASCIDRLVVPGAAARPITAPLAAPPPEYVHHAPGFAYDAVVTDLARTTDTATARWVATVVELPAEGLVLDGPRWPWLPTLTLVALLLPGATVVAVVVARRRRRGRTGLSGSGSTLSTGTDGRG
ncbi:DJ-1/PfpI family protein [Actinomycetospora straminea]|uniref:DJ-1/PfpI family protein n=1 Tax=Actinomycetospora straminea TaxID=663607 RepID=A0ABP9FAT6_9PSEU|nr:DJ-1/PfpI family protein [Actinomycetospora straminea]MDD7936733.1 DJ-1/PfpI family protein [Actinomycetospora straminea]